MISEVTIDIAARAFTESEVGTDPASVVQPAFIAFAEECIFIAQDEWPVDTGDSVDAWTSEVSHISDSEVEVMISNEVRDRDYDRPYAAYVYRRGVDKRSREYQQRVKAPRALRPGSLGPIMGAHRVWLEKFRIMKEEAIPELLDQSLNLLLESLGG